jgi:hypothetical protein
MSLSFPRRSVVRPRIEETRILQYQHKEVSIQEEEETMKRSANPHAGAKNGISVWSVDACPSYSYGMHIRRKSLLISS